MVIGFDAKRLFNNFTGLGNYSRFVVESIHRYTQGNQLVLFTPSVRRTPDTSYFFSQPDIRIVEPSSFLKAARLGSVWRSFLQRKQMGEEKVDLYHGLSHELPAYVPKNIRKVVTVHDLIFYRYPQFYNKVDVAIYKRKVRYACKVADRIVAISSQTKEDIVTYLGVDPAKISVVYQGCHANFRRHIEPDERRDVRQRYGLPKRYLLTVGTIEERKNGMLLLKAMHHLKSREDVHLVIIGKATRYLAALQSYIAEVGLEKHITFLYDVRFEDLPAIYQMAEVFVYPSLFEGFGIPLVEAAHSDVPIITSTGSCFSEAAGPDALYVEPHDDRALSEAIQQLWGNEPERTRRVIATRQYVSQFDPERVAESLNEVYQSLQ